MRDRLIDSISRCCAKNLNMVQMLEFEKLILADFLLEEGWMKPPCKVGDKVYIIDEGDECTEPYVLNVTVTATGYDIGGFWITMDLPLGFKMSAHIGERSFGKTVFLTKEAAEQALKGGAE